MGPLLYRWSTAAQLASVLMIALFYATLARSLKRAELTWWARAWWFDFGALVVTVSYWFLTPPTFINPALRAGYVGGKVLYAVLLVQGARALARPGSQWLSRRALWIIGVAAMFVGTLLLPNINSVGVAVQGGLGILLLWTGHTLYTSRGKAVGWLAAGCLARGAIALIEAVAYAGDMLPAGTLSPQLAQATQLFLGSHSALDLAAEWLLALGGVVAVTQRGQHELESANDDLLSVQAQLRNLADRDPLTGLANRRALPETFRGVFTSGALFVFFDLDGFKAINDTHGHAEGDKCLVRFAGALRGSFRPTDAIIRYAGDEFVVIAPSMSVEMLEERIEQMRARVGHPDDNGVALSFSAGISILQPGGDAEAALQSADNAMYAAKGARTSLGVSLSTAPA